MSGWDFKFIIIFSSYLNCIVPIYKYIFLINNLLKTSWFSVDRSNIIYVTTATIWQAVAKDDTFSLL